jgi:hypothetical protein
MHVCSRLKTTPRILLLALIIGALSTMQLVAAEQPITRSQDVQLNVGDSLVVASNRMSIERVLVEGNVSYAGIKKPSQYPADSFAISAYSPAIYLLVISFDFQSDYQIRLFVQAPNGSMISNSSTYYISNGPFELDVKVSFSPRANATSIAAPSTSPWEGFVSWLDKFGEAFPMWVKLVYLAFGIQFFSVGGLWIRRETSKRETGVQHLDTGDRAFLWTDVAYKFLLVSFLTIIAIMGGEVLVLFILRFMFLASLDLLSLWDLFVVGFAAGAVIIAYLTRFTLEKAFDLKPVEDD